MLRSDAEALPFARSGRDLANAGHGADHLLLGGFLSLSEFFESSQVISGHEGDEGLSVPGHDDALTAVDPQARLGDLVGFLPLEQMQRIDYALTGLLDLS